MSLVSVLLGFQFLLNGDRRRTVVPIRPTVGRRLGGRQHCCSVGDKRHHLRHHCLHHRCRHCRQRQWSSPWWARRQWLSAWWARQCDCRRWSHLVSLSVGHLPSWQQQLTLSVPGVNDDNDGQQDRQCRGGGAWCALIDGSGGVMLVYNNWDIIVAIKNRILSNSSAQAKFTALVDCNVDWSDCLELMAYILDRYANMRGTYFIGKTLHIPSFSKTRSPWTVCTFCVIPEQGKCVKIFMFVPRRSTK